MTSVLSSALLQEGSKFVHELNTTHAAFIKQHPSFPPIHFLMEFITNRACPSVDVNSIPANVLLVCKDNWEEAMGPIFGTRNLQYHQELQSVAEEQSQQLQATGGYVFPARIFTEEQKEQICNCSGDCSIATDCRCMQSKSRCNDHCHAGTASSSSSSVSHSHCHNPLNLTSSISITHEQPLSHARAGDAACKCTTSGCRTDQCSCRKKGKLACTTACHGMHGHDQCTHRGGQSASASTSTAAAASKKKRSRDDKV